MEKGSGAKGLMLKTVTNTKANTLLTRNQDSEFSLGSQATSTEVVTRTMNAMGTAKCIGQTAPAIKVNGKVVSNTVSAQ